MPLWFMRHGETNYNRLGLCNDNPQRDVHLTDTGIRQAAQAADTTYGIWRPPTSASMLAPSSPVAASATSTVTARRSRLSRSHASKSSRPKNTSASATVKGSSPVYGLSAATSSGSGSGGGEAEGAFQYVQGLADAYAEETGVNITVVNKQVETLREDFLTSSLAGGAPEMLWTVADHVGPFTASGTIAPLDDLIDISDLL